MEIMIGNCEYKLTGDTLEDLQVKSIKDNDVYVRRIFVPDSDGKLLLEQGIVTYHEGDVVMILARYDNEKEDYIVRPVVLTNPILAEVVKELDK